MIRRSFWLSVALVVLIAGSVLTTLIMLTQHEPAFYARSAVPPGQQRKDVSWQFMTRASSFVQSIKEGGNPNVGWPWGGCFTEEQINSFFAEGFADWSLGEKLSLPEGISEPRVAFEQDRIRLGFRYNLAFWSTVIAIDFRVWLAHGEPNVVILELKGVHAGSLPISAQSLLEAISETLLQQNIQVSWYRHNGNPTAAVKFQTDQPQSVYQLQRVDLKPGTLTMAGHTNAGAN